MKNLIQAGNRTKGQVYFRAPLLKHSNTRKNHALRHCYDRIARHFPDRVFRLMAEETAKKFPDQLIFLITPAVDGIISRTGNLSNVYTDRNTSASG